MIELLIRPGRMFTGLITAGLFEVTMVMMGVVFESMPSSAVETALMNSLRSPERT